MSIPAERRSAVIPGSPFLMSLVAKVVKSTWLDSENRNKTENPDYLIMVLEVPSWTEGETFQARIKAPSNDPHPMIDGRMYDIRGRVYFKKPRGRQYLDITWQSELPEVLDAQAQEAGRPRFEVVCNITGVFGKDKIGMIWGAQEEHGQQTLRQYVSTTCQFSKKEVEEVAKFAHMLWKIEGQMLGPNDLQITTMQIVPSHERIPLD